MEARLKVVPCSSLNNLNQIRLHYVHDEIRRKDIYYRCPRPSVGWKCRESEKYSRKTVHRLLLRLPSPEPKGVHLAVRQVSKIYGRRFRERCFRRRLCRRSDFQSTISGRLLLQWLL